MSNKLRSILKQMNVVQSVDSLSDDANLFSAGALDSLTLVQFVLLIEDEFKIRIENTDIGYDQFQTFQKISALLRDKHKVET
ncbi:MAG: hypothetical protein IPJ84_00495 [Bdellovibrionales bacterium]|nr:hypothetical protein [Bdellovibrionales bacterium]